jgi:hypothetical protein
MKMLVGDDEEGEEKRGQQKQNRLVELLVSCVGEPVLEGTEQASAVCGKLGRPACFRATFRGVWGHTLLLIPHRVTGTLKNLFNYNLYLLGSQWKPFPQLMAGTGGGMVCILVKTCYKLNDFSQGPKPRSKGDEHGYNR